MAGSSFITNSAAEALNLEATEKQEPFCINGFGNHYTDVIDEYVVITFQNSVNVEFNLIETICDPIMPVTANVFNFWPELLRFQDQMTTKIPRPSLQVDMLLGLKDLYRVLYTNMTTNPVVRINEKSGLKLEETYFGYLLKGGINNALIYEIGTTRMKTSL